MSYELQVGDRVVDGYDDLTAGTVTGIEPVPGYPADPIALVVWDDDPDRVPCRVAAHELDRAPTLGADHA